MPVKHTKAKRGCRNEKIFSVPQVRQQEDEWHNVKDSQVCFQRILSGTKSILGSGTVWKSCLAFCHGQVMPLPWAACLTLQVICLFCSASVSLVFSKNPVYSFICPAYIFLWLTLPCTSPSLLPFLFRGPQLRESLLCKQRTSAYFVQLHISTAWSWIIYLERVTLTRSCSHEQDQTWLDFY